MKNSKVFVIALILIVLFWVLYLFKSFLMIIAISTLLAVATSNLNAKWLKLLNGRVVLAAFCTTLMLLSLFFIPFVYTLVVLGKSLAGLDINHIKESLGLLKNYHFALPGTLSFLEPKIDEFFASLDLSKITKNSLYYLSNLTKFGAKFLMDIILICVFYFFANLYGVKLVDYLRKVVPIANKELNSILSEVSNVMAVVFYSVLIVAIFQGLLFAFIASIFGYDGILFGVIFAFSSLIPAVGGALIYIPLSLYELVQNGTQNALIIFIYSVVVISGFADTLVKPLIIKWINEKLVSIPTEVNELLIFFSMIAGISSFGFWGIILGPAIVTFFLSMIKLYVILNEKHIV